MPAHANLGRFAQEEAYRTYKTTISEISEWLRLGQPEPNTRRETPCTPRNLRETKNAEPRSNA